MITVKIRLSEMVRSKSPKIIPDKKIAVKNSNSYQLELNKGPNLWYLKFRITEYLLN